MKNHFKFLLVLLLFAFCFLIFKDLASAQAGNPSLSITAFPAIQDKEVTAGQSSHLQVQFKNSSDSLTAGKIKIADFKIGDKNGAPLLIEGEPVEKPKYSASAWI